MDNQLVVISCRTVILVGLTWSKTWEAQPLVKCRTWVARARMLTQLAPAMTTATIMTAIRKRVVARANAARRMTSRVVTSSVAIAQRPI